MSEMIWGYGPSTEWICAIDHEGRTHINNLTFELFLTMEYCIRNHVLAGSEYRDVQAQLKQNDDILFCWSVLTASWSDDIAMIIDLWIVIRGFSMASAWVDHYKVTQKKTTQKSKALRKAL